MNKHDATGNRRTAVVTVLVAFEDRRRVYRDVFVRAIRDLRPALTVRSAPLEGLERALERFDPDVVVCSQPNRYHLTGHGAWVHLPTDDGRGGDEQLAEICLDGERWRTEGPPLSELLAVIDETQERMREGNLKGSC